MFIHRLFCPQEWKQQQLQTGEAEENANFQPIAVDWRERVKKARGAGQAQADSPLLNGAHGAGGAGGASPATAGDAAGDDEQSRPQVGGAAAAVAAATAAAAAVGVGAKKKRKGLDLKALSAGLPAGWQVRCGGGAAAAAAAVGVGAKKKRKGPDLKALSAGLPAGWQVGCGTGR
ncbi:unnamed protein product [Closterium sp. Naga37s-1]|nr:unnamed protein product [Closterium sp. Naga37s-1]